MFRISEEGLTLIKTSEAFRGRLYNCPAGHCTIGYGHLVHYGPIGVGDPAKGITPERAAALEAPFRDGLTEPQASALLREDLKRYETSVHQWVKVPLDQSEYDALVDFEYNTGALAKMT